MDQVRFFKGCLPQILLDPIGRVFFLVYQIAILECNELETNYFFDCFAGFPEMVFSWKEIMIRTVKFPYQSHAKYESY